MISFLYGPEESLGNSEQKARKTAFGTTLNTNVDIRVAARKLNFKAAQQSGSADG
jgi:hypothetical protein